MKTMTYQLNENLAKIYDEIRSEIGFEFALSDLMTDIDVWETDITSSLKEAYQHLFRGSSRVITDAEKTGHMLLAELYIRDLVEHLKDELAVFPTPNSGPERAQSSQLGCTSHRQKAERDSLSFAGENIENVHHCDFSRNVTTIDVAVDHFSDTNFFSGISYDIHSIGLFVATYNILQVGTALNVRVALPGRTSFQMKGTVSWVRELDNCAEDVSPGMGITFEKLSREPSRAIRRFMDERQPLLFEVA